MSHALLPDRIFSSAHQVVTNVDIEFRRWELAVSSIADNFEFSGLHSRHRGEITFDFAEKFVATRYHVPGKSPAQDFDPGSRTLRDFTSRMQ